MSFTYDPTTARGQVRLLIGDTDSVNPIFQDADIDGFLAIRSDNVNRAAATALRTMAASEAYIQKKTKVGDITTDGPAVAKALNDLADKLWAADDDEATLEIAEWSVNGFAYQDIYFNDALRQGL